MKIGLISQPFDAFIPPSMNSIGIWINEVSRNLAKEHEVTVYGRRGRALPGEIGGGVQTRYVYGLPNRWLKKMDSRLYPLLPKKKPFYALPWYTLEYILPIALDLRRQMADMVHLQNFSQFVPVIRAVNPHIKIVLHMRCEWLALLDYAMIDRRLRQTDLILGVSNYITDQIRERFPQHAAKCATAYTGVDVAQFQPLDNPIPVTGSPADAPRRVVFVSRITPEKGVHVLLQAFIQIAGQFPDLQLELIGGASSLPKDQLVSLSDRQQIIQLERFYSGSYLETLKAMLPPSLQNRVHFLGNLHYSEVLEHMQQADLLVNPALTEPFGRSLIEANACGVPIIASRTGGMTELIEPGRNGLLFTPGDAGELARAMRNILENDDLRTRMGRNGRSMVMERFSWESITDQLNDRYLQLLQAPFVQKPI